MNKNLFELKKKTGRKKQKKAFSPIVVVDVQLVGVTNFYSIESAVGRELEEVNGPVDGNHSDAILVHEAHVAFRFFGNRTRRQRPERIRILCWNHGYTTGSSKGRSSLIGNIRL